MGTFRIGSRLFLAAALFFTASGFSSECAKQTQSIYRTKVRNTNRLTKNLVRLGLVVAASLSQTSQAGITSVTGGPTPNPIVSTPAQPVLGMPPVPDKNFPLIEDPAAPRWIDIRTVPCPAGVGPGDCQFMYFAVVDVIDTFSAPAPDAGFGGALPFGQSVSRSDATPTVLGDERDLEITGNKAGTARANLLQTKEGRSLLRLFQQAGTVAQFSSTYDGKDANVKVRPNGLGTYSPVKRQGDRFLVGVDFASHPGRIRIVVYDAGDEKNLRYSEAVVDVAPTDRLIEYSVLFSQFQAGPAGPTDFAQIGAIQVFVEPSLGEQKEDAVFDLDYLQVAHPVCQPCENPTANIFRQLAPAGFGAPTLASGLGYDGDGTGGFPGFYGGFPFFPFLNNGGLVDISPMFPHTEPMAPGNMWPTFPNEPPGINPTPPISGVPGPPSGVLMVTGTIIALLVLRFRPRG